MSGRNNNDDQLVMEYNDMHTDYNSDNQAGVTTTITDQREVVTTSRAISGSRRVNGKIQELEVALQLERQQRQMAEGGWERERKKVDSLHQELSNTLEHLAQAWEKQGVCAAQVVELQTLLTKEREEKLSIQKENEQLMNISDRKELEGNIIRPSWSSYSSNIVEELERQLDSERQRIRELEHKYQQQRELHSNVEQMLQHANQKLQNEARRAESLEKDIHSKEDECRWLHQQIETLNSQVQRVESPKDSIWMERINELEQTLRSTQQECRSKTQRWESEREHVSQIEKDLDERIKELRTLQELTVQKDLDLTETQQTLRRVQQDARMERHRAELEKSRADNTEKELERIHQISRDREALLADTQRTLQQTQHEHRMEKQRIQAESSRIHQLETHLSQCQHQLNEKVETISELQRNLSKTLEDLNLSRQELESCRSQCESLERELRNKSSLSDPQDVTEVKQMLAEAQREWRQAHLQWVTQQHGDEKRDESSSLIRSDFQDSSYPDNDGLRRRVQQAEESLLETQQALENEREACWLLRRQCDAQARRAELAETQLEQVNKTLSRIQQDQQTLTMQMNILQRSLEEERRLNQQYPSQLRDITMAMNSEQESHKQTYQELETVRSHLDRCQQELVQVRSRLRELECEQEVIQKFMVESETRKTVQLQDELERQRQGLQHITGDVPQLLSHVQAFTSKVQSVEQYFNPPSNTQRIVTEKTRVSSRNSTPSRSNEHPDDVSDLKKKLAVSEEREQKWRLDLKDITHRLEMETHRRRAMEEWQNSLKLALKSLVSRIQEGDPSFAFNLPPAPRFASPTTPTRDIGNRLNQKAGLLRKALEEERVARVHEQTKNDSIRREIIHLLRSSRSSSNPNEQLPANIADTISPSYSLSGMSSRSSSPTFVMSGVGPLSPLETLRGSAPYEGRTSPTPSSRSPRRTFPEANRPLSTNYPRPPSNTRSTSPGHKAIQSITSRFQSTSYTSNPPGNNLPSSNPNITSY